MRKDTRTVAREKTCVNFANRNIKDTEKSALVASRRTRALFSTLVVIVVSALFVYALLSSALETAKTARESHKELRQKTGIFVINKETFVVEVAKTEKERIQGLSDRSEMPHGGMFFIFDKNERHGIWMKDMQFPIDILWLGSDFAVVDFKENVLPNTYPEIFVPESPVRYVVEIPSGMLHRLGIQKGDPTLFTFSDK